jgi:hypothetical protein
MADTLVFTLVTNEKIYLEVDDGADALINFRNRHTPFGDEWIDVGNEQLVRRDSIVTVQVTSGGAVFGTG